MMRTTIGSAFFLTAMVLLATPLSAQTVGGSTSTSTTTSSGGVSTGTNNGVTYGSSWSSQTNTQSITPSVTQSGAQGNVQGNSQMGAPVSILPGSNTTSVGIGNRQAQSQPEFPPPAENPDDNRAARPSDGANQAAMNQNSSVRASSSNSVPDNASEGSSVRVGGGSITGVGPGNATLSGSATLPELQIQRRPGETTGTVQ